MDAQVRLNAVGMATFTAVLKVIEIGAEGAAFTAPLVGEVTVTVGATSVVNEKVKSAAGGVPRESWIWAAEAFTMHGVPAGQLVEGVSVKVEAVPGSVGDTVNDCAELGQTTLKAVDWAVTDSLKVIEITCEMGTPVAPLIGIVEVTCGGWSVVNETVVSVPR